MRRCILLAIAAAMALCGSALAASAGGQIRIGVLKFGTVGWELDTLNTHGLDAKRGISVEVVPFAGEDASAIAFRAGAVDVIVTDWIEVARQRAEGEQIAFVPYSTSSGAIMVPGGSALKSVSDLRGIRLAVAGGPLDKSWLLLQAMAKKETGMDLAAENEIVFGAPPLLAEKLRQGEFDAALNFWHFNARLEADGFRRLVGASEAAQMLGAASDVATLGYVFREDWAAANHETLAAFLAAARDAKALLASSDGEWDRLRAEGAIADEGKALAALREGYRRGIPRRPPADEAADAARLYRVLAGIGGPRLVGQAQSLPEGTFWLGHGD